MREQRSQDAARRAADLAVARVERRRAAAEVRHDDLDRDRRDARPRRRRSRRPRAAAAARRRTRARSPRRRARSPPCTRSRAAAKTANGSSRSSSRYQNAYRSSGHASATGWNSFSVSHCGRGIEQVGEREARARRAREPRCLRASQNTGSAPSATATAWTTSSMSGLGQASQSGANAARIGSKCEPSREICSPARFVTCEEVAVRRRPDRLRHVPEVEAAGVEGALAADRERGEADRERGDRRPEQDASPSHASPSSRPRQRAPSTSSLACSR